MIRIACPKCRTGFQLADNLAGKRIRCKNCASILAVPDQDARKPVPAKAAVPTKAAAAAKAPPPAAEGPDNITPYGIQPVLEISEDIKDNRVDQMVRTADRQKRRNRAWGKVGPAATWLKWYTLILAGLATLFFFWWLVCCTLIAHKWEQIYRDHPGSIESKGKELRWTFPLDNLFEWNTSVWFVLGIGCAVYFPLMVVSGITLAGTENARRLENYRTAVTGACFGLLLVPMGPLFGLLFLMRLRDPEVMYEFEISQLRQEGVDWETLEDEQLAAEEEEDEEEELDDEDEEEEDEPTPRRRR